MTVRAETKDGKRVEVVKFEMTDTGEYRFKIYLEDNRQNEIIAQGYRRFRRGLITATEMVTEIDKKLDAFRNEREGYEMYSFADIFQIAKALTDLKEDGTFRVQFLNNVKPYRLDPKSMTVEAI